MMFKIICALFLVCYLLPSWALNVGVGMADMTGPSVEINFMGYALPSQRGSGIHQRLRARAFAFEDEGKRIVYVSVDGGMGSDLVKMRVIEKLNAQLGDGVYSHVRNIFSPLFFASIKFLKFLFRKMWQSVELTPTLDLEDSNNMSSTKLQLWVSLAKPLKPGLMALPMPL